MVFLVPLDGVLTVRLEADPSLFYGFWGACFNDYRRTAPHEGYGIIKNWRDMLFYKNDAFQKRFDERSMPQFVFLIIDFGGVSFTFRQTSFQGNPRKRS
jgi:hypothetical protein